MGRVDDKESESLLSEADEEKDRDRDTSEVDEDKEPSDSDVSQPGSQKKYKCKVSGCDARFLRPSRLIWHTRKHNEERPYKCDREGCDRAYTNSSHLKRHLNTTHKPSTTIYQCKECGMELGSLFSLKRHNKKIHDPTRLTCNQCGAKFRKKHCYNEHLSMHAGVAMYKCDVCPLNFTTLRLYKKHHLTHENLKSYSCRSTGCEEIFDKWSQLKKHMEIEHEFDWKCEKCNKKFKHRKQLQLHSNIHAREGLVSTCPYENCPRFYSFEKNLDEHILTAHMGRKFVCDTCEKPFAFKSAVARHIQVVHEGKGKPVPKTTKTQRRRRKDAGIPKKSMIGQLVGVKLTKAMEECILRRETRIVLEKIGAKCLKKIVETKKIDGPDFREDEIFARDVEGAENVEKLRFGTSEVGREISSAEETIVTANNEIERANDEIQTSNNEIERANNENETILVDPAESFVEKNDELLASVINALQTEKPVVMKDLVEGSSDLSGKKSEVISTFLTDLLSNETPVVLAESVGVDTTGSVDEIIGKNVTTDGTTMNDVGSTESSPRIIIEIIGDWV